MNVPTEAIREKLMANNPEYRRLKQEHSHYAEQLERLARKPFLSEQEQIEETKLKKLKLHIKDEMERLVQQYRQV